MISLFYMIIFLYVCFLLNYLIDFPGLSTMYALLAKSLVWINCRTLRQVYECAVFIFSLLHFYVIFVN